MKKPPTLFFFFFLGFYSFAHKLTVTHCHAKQTSRSVIPKSPISHIGLSFLSFIFSGFCLFCNYYLCAILIFLFSVWCCVCCLSRLLRVRSKQGIKGLFWVLCFLGNVNFVIFFFLGDPYFMLFFYNGVWIKFLFFFVCIIEMSEKCVFLDLLILVWYSVFDVMLKSMSWQSYGTHIVCIVYWRLLLYSNFLDIILELPQNVSVVCIKFMMFMTLLLIFVMIRGLMTMNFLDYPPQKKKKNLKLCCQTSNFQIRFLNALIFTCTISSNLKALLGD